MMKQVAGPVPIPEAVSLVPQQQAPDRCVANAGALVRTSEPPPALAVAGTHVFREAAIAAYLRGDREARMLRAEPAWPRRLFCAGALLAATLVTFAIWGRVDVTARGLGILQADGDLQFARTEIAGVVAEVHAHSGDLVQSGQPIVTLTSTSLRALMLEADRNLQLAKTQAAEFETLRGSLFANRRSILADRVRILEGRLAVVKRGLARKGNRARRHAALAAGGWSSRFDAQRSQEEVLDARAQKLGSAEQLERAKAEIVSLDLESDAERRRVTNAADEAQTRRDALEVAIAQTTIRAAKPGTLDSVLVRRGDTVPAGATVAKIVSGTAQRIIAFIPERDRAFLEPGAPARVELTQLPAAEFGALRATVTRVASAIASPAEVKDVLGDQASLPAPVYRVDLTLDPTPRRAILGSRIHAGGIVDVRYVLRQRRIASLVFSRSISIAERR